MRISISMRRLLSGGLALFQAAPAAAFAHASEGQLGTYTPQLLAVLAGLSDAQLQQLNCPLRAASSVQVRADVANNPGLLAVLAGRTSRLCRPAGNAAGRSEAAPR